MRAMGKLMVALATTSLLAPAASAAGVGLQWKKPVPYTLKKGRMELTGSVHRVDDNIDIFDIRETQLTDAQRSSGSEFASFGDYQAFGLTLNFGMTDRLQLHADLDFPQIDYSRDTLKVTSFDTALKYRLSESRRLTTAIEGGMRYNRGDDLVVKLADTGMDSISLGSYTWYPVEGILEMPPSITLQHPDLQQPDFLQSSVRISGIEDRTFYGRLMGGLSLTNNLVATGYLEYGSTEVESLFQSDLSFLESYIDKLGYDQTHYALGLGLDWRVLEKLILAGYYRHIQVDRDIDSKISGGETTNNILTGQIHYLLSEHLALTLEGRAYTNNLLGDINFLYNEFSYDRFDKKYGYAGLALSWAYDY